MKKIGWLTMAIAGLFVLTYSSPSSADQAAYEELKAKLHSEIAESEVMELRLFLSKGKIVWVEPIPQKELVNSQVKPNLKYAVDIVKDLRKENIRGVGSVAIQQDSPGCAYWFIYETSSGIVKICLVPLP